MATWRRWYIEWMLGFDVIPNLRPLRTRLAEGPPGLSFRSARSPMTPLVLCLEPELHLPPACRRYYPQSEGPTIPVVRERFLSGPAK